MDKYEYTLTDHLGNSRMTFSDRNDDGIITIGGPDSEVLQESHYYPFGMAMDGNWVTQVGEKNRYLYNGKELNEDFGLDWLDYGARWYDPAIGRWNAVDPLAEDYYPYSPYSYTLNNPILFIDPDGKSVDDIIIRNSSCSCVDEFVNTINENFNGQFQAFTEDIGDGAVRLRIEATKGGGDLSKLSKGQQIFYNELNNVAEIQEKAVHLEIVSGDGDVNVGKYNTYPAKIDIADIKQFPALDGSKEIQDAGTQAGKIVHEVIEQYFKQVVDENREVNLKEFNYNHSGDRNGRYGQDKGDSGGATGRENSVNGNYRIGNFLYQNPQTGAKHRQTYRNGPNGVIIVSKAKKIN